MQDLIFDLNIKTNKEFIRGRRLETLPIDDWCSIKIDKEEFDKIIDRLIEIPN
jgi:hypothetical protein